MNRDVRVNNAGQVSLPLIGGVMAGGKTIPELEKDIGAKLEKGYLQNPQVTVFIKEFTSQRVTLEGALKKPGIYPITGKTSLLQAIAMAEGVDELADLGGVVVRWDPDAIIAGARRGRFATSGKKRIRSVRAIRSARSPHVSRYRRWYG